MAVTTTHVSREYTSTGIETVLAVDFQFLAPEHLIVTKGLTGVETTLALGTDFTVSGPSAPLPGTGSITLTAPATAGHKVKIRRSTPRTQTTSLNPAGSLSTSALVSMDDKLTLIVQEIAEGATYSNAAHGNLGGGDLHADATTSVDGFYPAADKLANDNHRANTSNPHATTAGQVGAAPVAHVGSTDGHPKATAAADGLMSKEHFAIVDALQASVNPVNVLVLDHYEGQALDTTVWTRTTSGTAPTASFPAGFEFGVYRETTAAANPSVVTRRSNVRCKVSRAPVWNGAYGFGAAGPSLANVLARMGLAEDPATLSANYAYFRVNPGGTLDCVSRAAGSEQATTLGTLASLFGVAPAENAVHAFKIELSSSSVKFYVAGALVATHTLQVPGASVLVEAFSRLENSGGSVAQSMDADYDFVTGTVAYP